MDLSQLLTKCEASLKARKFQEAIQYCQQALSAAPDNQRAKDLLEEAQSRLEADVFVRENLKRAQESFQNRDFQKCINECQKIQLLDPDNASATELLNKAQEKLEAEPFIQNFVTSGQSLFDSGLYGEAISQWEKVGSIDPTFPGLQQLITKAKAKMGGGQEPAAATELPDFADLEIDNSDGIGGGSSQPPSAAAKPPAAAAGAPFESESSFDFDSGEVPSLEIPGMAPPSMEDVPSFELPEEPSSTPPQGGGGQQSEPDAFSFFGGGGTAAQPAAGEVPSGGEFGFGSDKDRIDQLLKEGDALHEKGQYQKAIDTWSEIFMLDVNHPEALQKIEAARGLAEQQRARNQDLLKEAQAVYEKGDLQSAQSLLSSILASDPDHAEARRYLDMVEEASKAQPGADDLVARGREAEAKGSYREAAQLYSQALSMNAEDADLAERVKNCNLLAKKQDQAKTMVGNARAFMVEGKFESARHALSKILETDPQNQEALQLMQELKGKPAMEREAEQEGEEDAVAAGAAPRAAARAAAAKKAFPVIPVAILGGLIILAAIIVGYLKFFRGETQTTLVTPPPIKKIVKKTPPKQMPQTMEVQTQSVAGGVTPEAREQAIKLIQEANFYFQEKHYPEAIQKTDQALALDPGNADAVALKEQATKVLQELEASERKMLDDANSYFGYSEFAGAVTLYEKYLAKHPESTDQVQPQIIKCYYNLGVLAMRQWNCNMAADYFRQVLFIDKNDKLSTDALTVAKRCQQVGTGDLEVRKAITFLEMRK